MWSEQLNWNLCLIPIQSEMELPLQFISRKQTEPQWLVHKNPQKGHFYCLKGSPIVQRSADTSNFFYWILPLLSKGVLIPVIFFTEYSHLVVASSFDALCCRILTDSFPLACILLAWLLFCLISIGTPNDWALYLDHREWNTLLPAQTLSFLVACGQENWNLVWWLESSAGLQVTLRYC
jgi:hypothetical protein